MSFFRNARLAGATAVQHLGDDPVLLLLQVSRRVPAQLVYRVGQILRLLPTATSKALGAHLLGMGGVRDDVIDRALTADVSKATAARLADIALAANDAVRADRLISKAGSAAGTLARRRWHEGDMTGAIEELSSAGLHRKAKRLESELRVFQGWTPVLQFVPGYRPQDRTVLHILTNSLPYTGSGYAQRSHSILKAQAQQGWSVHAVTRLGYPVEVGKLAGKDHDEIDEVSYHRLIPAKMPAGFDERLQAQAEAVLRKALEIRPAILHTTTHFVNGLITRAVADALDIPWVYEVRGQLADTWASTRGDAAKSSQRYKLFTECELAVTRSAALVVTLGESMKQQILEAGGARGDVLLSPNAVGENFLNEPMAASAARALLGLRREGAFVGSVSSLVDYEGLDVLIRAIAHLATERPRLNCLIVGDGAAAPGLRQLARELGIDSRVIFTGRVPREQAHLYHQALDVFVVPRLDLDVTRAVTPLKPVEAMAAGRPVVASNLPALREIVEDSVTGRLIEADNVDALAKELLSLTEDEGASLTPAAIAMGMAGRERALKERTWALHSQTILDAYGALGAAS